MADEWTASDFADLFKNRWLKQVRIREDVDMQDIADAAQAAATAEPSRPRSV